uniref:Uncharacterized protein n=1 Tax=Oryza nivara TaxID=4536 RepID=A0A0E0GTK2_ORYNI
MAEGGEVLGVARGQKGAEDGDGAPRGAVVLSRQCRFREGGAEYEAAVHATRGGNNGGEGEVRVSIDGKRVAEVSYVGWGFRSKAPSPSPSLRLPVRHLPVASSAAPSGAAASATECPRFLERCGLNADEFDDDAEAEPTVGLFGRSIRGLAEVNFTAVAGGREEGKAIVMAGSGLSLLSGSGNVLPFVLASPSSSQKIPHCWLHR